MAKLSLDQLKEENTAAEEKVIADEAAANDVEEEVVALEEHIETEEIPKEEEPKPEGEDTPKPEEAEIVDGEVQLEEWQKTGEEAGDEVKKEENPNEIAKAIRLRATAKADRKHEAELTKLREENAALRNPAPVTTGLSKPNRDDFLDKDDPDTAYLDALADYNSKKQMAEMTASQQATEAQRTRDKNAQAINANVDKHYAAAAQLSETSKITPESYRSADLAVRQMVEELYPDAGDALVDAFISKVGAGSERVFYNLGINKIRLAQFKEKLVDDPTGLDAAIFLGGLNKELGKGGKRKSSAPAPAGHAQGDVTNKGTANERKLKEQYDNAHKKDQGQAAYNFKKRARAAGIDTSRW